MPEIFMTIPLIDPWSELSLVGQFAVAGGVVMTVAAVTSAFFVSSRIEETIVRNTANATALYTESFISPLTQDLATGPDLSDQSRAEIDTLLEATALGQRVVSFKIWSEDGLLIYASNTALIGQRFPVTENLRQAWNGEVRADYNDTGDAEDVAEHALGVPLLEIYTPIRETRTGRIFAVAEFYEIATQLRIDVVRARRLAWTTVAGIVALISASLFAIVLRGSRTIDRQLTALKQMANHNLALRLRVQRAAARFSAISDQSLRRIGADLHDGPAQLMGFAALRLDSLRQDVVDDKARTVVDEVIRAVKDSMREVRNISRGLSLPDIEQRPLDAILKSVADIHSARTGSEVIVDCPVEGLPDVSIATKICCFRAAQEGLSNAWRHGGGKGQGLRLRITDNRLRLCILDRGPGFPTLRDNGGGDGDDNGLGLAGLTDRVESLGGHISTRNRDHGGGAELCIELDLDGAA
jgi:signal transduction histidine kinase